MKHLGTVLRKLRVFHDMSQREMCVLLDVKQSYMSQLESEDKGVRLETIYTYAKIFKIRASSILWMAENYETPNAVPQIPLSPKVKAMAKLLHEIQTTEKEDIQ